MSFLFALFQGDALYQQTVYGTATFWSSVFLLVFLVLHIFSMEKLFNVVKQAYSNSIAIYTSFLLISFPILYKVLLLFLHNVSILIEVNPKIQFALVVVLLVFAFMNYLLSLGAQEIQYH
jgi:hypothetical protein